MKRPEGVSGPVTRGAASPPPMPTQKMAQKVAQKPTEERSVPKPGPRMPAAKKSAAAKNSRPLKAPRAPRSLRTSPDRSRRSELRAAERARKRFERQEVKRFTRLSRRRRLGWAVAAGLLVAILALVVTAVFSPLLALRHITVDGTSRLDHAKLEQAVDGQLGTPLALLDDARITRDLGPFRLIRSYVTEIVPPDTLVIHVVERTPVGAIQTASGFELVDPAGVVIDSSKTRPPAFPLIQLGTGSITGPGFAPMTEVLLALPSSVLSKVDTITALTHDDVTLTLAGSNQRVVWGSSDNSEQKAKVLARLVALQGSSGPGEYDVSAPGTVVFHQG